MRKDAKIDQKEKRKGPYPHEKRVQRYAYVALLATVGLAAAILLTAETKLLGEPIPFIVPGTALVLGAILGVVAIARRASGFALGGAVLLALAVIPAGSTSPGPAAYATGVLFGLALLLTFELVHMTQRYERAHRAVDEDGVPEEHINRVTDEALKTLVSRAAVAALAVGVVVGLAYLLSTVGPRQWRAAVETTAPLGVAVIGLAIAGALSLFILSHGAKLRLRREPKPKELLPDAVE